MSYTLTISNKKIHTTLIKHQINGLEAPEELFEVKKFINTIFSGGGYIKSAYTSFDLDPWSTWFYVTTETGMILSAMRVVEKKPNNFIPIEMAIIKGSHPPKRYSVLEDHVADWNNVAFVKSRTGWRAAVLNFAMVAQFCLEQKYNMVYGFYDLKMPSIVRIYESVGVSLSEKYNKPVYFPGSTLNGTPVQLSIIEITKTNLQKTMSKIL
ncbi:hypothetical protein EHQ13_06205 [Leptospira gomenensis]|uniref:GNAT family N-acetyltransferase n=1 Tax=Leptospira gomenensis TaxID=2484974 RepID=A0A5F1YGD0_9LEPT|nr:hypothetical protein [Leptospira gomenensis]TGK39186.1 hypothetical protein EHQ17_00475 [Leptospira gomenensis]TGK44273.1 hypothetical protein EHQ07_12230 [Leptospira gomenensis]TGK65135.1 hypothetical protein EHQ13_06205 [Leptospira gomenensis]